MAATASPAAGGAGGAARPPSTEDDRPVTPRMVLIGFLLALSNFVVTLDMTIANVSVPPTSPEAWPSPYPAVPGLSPPTLSPKRSASRWRAG
ncbi:hypothetical protein ACFSTD_14725 [Novosphingobium colocasiae]